MTTIESIIICPKCNRQFNPIRWKLIKARFRKDFYVCDDCIDDKMRHKFVEKYFGYSKESPTVSKENFDLLLLNMALNDRFDLYNWFLRESSKHFLLSHSVYHEIKTASPYPKVFKNLMDFIEGLYSEDFYDHLINHLDDYSETEQMQIISSLSYPREFTEYRFKKDIKSIDSCFKIMFERNFDCFRLTPSDIKIISALFLKYSLVYWKNFASQLNEDELLQIIKSLLHVENLTKLSSSPEQSPIIEFCKVYFQPTSDLSQCDQLHDNNISFLNYILANSNNRFVPFGNNNYNSKSLSEFFSYHVSIKRSQEDLLGEEIARLETKEKILQEIRPLQEKLETVQNKLEFLDKKLKKEEILLEKIAKFRKLLNLNPIERLNYLSNDLKSPEYYPEYLIDIDEKYVNLLNIDTAVILKNKLKHCKKDYFKKLKIILNKRISNE